VLIAHEEAGKPVGAVERCLRQLANLIAHACGVVWRSGHTAPLIDPGVVVGISCTLS
jgi:hypothetical protein